MVFTKHANTIINNNNNNDNRDVHNDTLRILRFAVDEFISGDTATRANDFVDFVMERLFQYHPEPTVGGAPPSPLPEHLAKGAKTVFHCVDIDWFVRSLLLFCWLVCALFVVVLLVGFCPLFHQTTYLCESNATQSICMLKHTHVAAIR